MKLWGVAAAVLAVCQAQLVPMIPFDSSKSTTGTMIQEGRTGVAAMHAILLSESKIMIIDKAEWNEAQFDTGQSAFSVEYDLKTNTYRMLHLDTNTFCSGGGFLGNGTLISTGGGEQKGRQWAAMQGWRSIRHFDPCTDGTCEWHEWRLPERGQELGPMKYNRWYPTVQQLPGGDLLIMGGSIKGAKTNTDAINVPSFEFWPSRGDAVPFPFLNETLPHNLYPSVHLLPDGNLFVFANKQSIIYDYKNQKVVRRLPELSGTPRTYPLTGTSTMLPLSPDNDYQVEILICGGSAEMKGKSKASDDCGRINLSDPDPQWEMDTFVHRRLMPDGVLLPDGTILFINGCQTGFAGYNNRNRDPTFDPIIYDPSKPHGERWMTGLANTNIARMYHSVASAIPDGRVWVAGSNTNDPPNITAEYPTEFRVEYFSPPYLFQGPRPHVNHVPSTLEYAQTYTISLNLDTIATGDLRVALMNHGFVTHSQHMSQRQVILKHRFDDVDQLEIEVPPKSEIFPPGPGWLYVIHNGVPSVGVHVMVGQESLEI